MSVKQHVEQARGILRDLGMDATRSNVRSARTFLALAHVAPGTPWSEATGGMYTVHQLMGWIGDNLDFTYAENSRESIRRQTLHQFVDGGIVELNADDPHKPTNSSLNNYRIAPDLLPVLRAVGSDGYEELLEGFLSSIVTLREQQGEPRDMPHIPVTMPDGSEVRLSAGGQNVLIKAMVEEFCPRFAPGGKVLYIDDADHGMRRDQEALLASIGIALDEHGKAPDLIVWTEENGWLYLMEACSTHGPIDATRKRALFALFDTQRDNIVFVSCFPDRATMRQYLNVLAWETEVWCASDPDHVIHLDGQRFMGPYRYASVSYGDGVDGGEAE